MDTDPAAEAGIPHLLMQAANYRSDFTSPPLAASFKLDEGYSDETRSQAENEANPSSEDVMTLPAWVLAHSEADRAGKVPTQRPKSNPCSFGAPTLINNPRTCLQSPSHSTNVNRGCRC